MSSKILIIIASADKDKALTGLMYATNALKFQWFDEVKTIFFGPSETLMIDDSEVKQEVVNLAKAGETIACKFISDREGTSKAISELGVKVEYVGSIISDYIRNGYIPMVW